MIFGISRAFFTWVHRCDICPFVPPLLGFSAAMSAQRVHCLGCYVSRVSMATAPGTSWCPEPEWPCSGRCPLPSLKPRGAYCLWHCCLLLWNLESWGLCCPQCLEGSPVQAQLSTGSGQAHSALTSLLSLSGHSSVQGFAALPAIRITWGTWENINVWHVSWGSGLTRLGPRCV